MAKRKKSSKIVIKDNVTIGGRNTSKTTKSIGDKTTALTSVTPGANLRTLDKNGQAANKPNGLMTMYQNTEINGTASSRPGSRQFNNSRRGPPATALGFEEKPRSTFGDSVNYN